MDEAYRPLARSDALLIEPIGEELLLFDQQRQIAHSLNDVAARVWQGCDGQRDLGAIEAECRLDRQTLTLTLQRLHNAELLDGAMPDGAIAESAPAGGLSRRAILRRSVLAGVGAGLAIPVIRSITAPSIAAAASGAPRSANQQLGKAGEHCSQSSQCSTRSSICLVRSGEICARQSGQSCVHASSCIHSSTSGAACKSGVCTSHCSSDAQCTAGGFYVRCGSAQAGMACLRS